MSIEDEIYLNYSINEEKLRCYGFVAKDGKLVYTKKMPRDNLKNKKCWVSIILDDTLTDKVICTLVDDSFKSV